MDHKKCVEYDHDKGGWQTCPDCGDKEVYWPIGNEQYCLSGCFGNKCQNCGDIPGLDSNGDCLTVEAESKDGLSGMDMCSSCLENDSDMVRVVYEKRPDGSYDRRHTL